MIHAIRLIFVFGLLSAFSACGSVKQKKEVDILQPASLSFIELAPFFPKDTIAVGRFQVDKFSESWFPLFSETTSDPEVNALMKERNKTFRTLLKKESLELIGIDFLTASEIVFAITESGGVLAIQSKGIAQQPLSKKLLELAHVRIIGNTILLYPKASAEAIIKTEGMDVERLKSIPGKAKIVLHVLEPSNLIKKEPFSEFDSMNFSVETSGLIRLTISGNEKALNKTQLMFDIFVERFAEKMNESMDSEITSDSIRYLSETFFTSVLSKRVAPTTMEFKAILPKMMSDASPATMGMMTAVAIPAFLKYIKRSKVSEADYTLRKMTTTLTENGPCALPALPPKSSEIPAGGKKITASFEDPKWTVFGKFGKDPMYFSYRVEKRDPNILVLIAETNFDAGSAENHTITQELIFTGKADSDTKCVIKTTPPVTTHAFE